MCVPLISHVPIENHPFLAFRRRGRQRANSDGMERRRRCWRRWRCGGAEGQSGRGGRQQGPWAAREAWRASAMPRQPRTTACRAQFFKAWKCVHSFVSVGGEERSAREEEEAERCGGLESDKRRERKRSARKCAGTQPTAHRRNVLYLSRHMERKSGREHVYVCVARESFMCARIAGTFESRVARNGAACGVWHVWRARLPPDPGAGSAVDRLRDAV